jgi:hypothetical protein
MVVTVTQCLFSTVQSFIVAVVAERDFSKWKLHFDISLLAILYSVISTFFSPSSDLIRLSEKLRVKILFADLL